MYVEKKCIVSFERIKKTILLNCHRIRALALFLFTLLCLQQEALAFNCKEAGNKVEKLICADSEILEQDRILTVRFKDVLATADSVDEIRASQRKWLESRNACSDKTCIDKEYRNRNAELNNLSIRLKSWVSPNKFTRNLCTTVASQLVKNQLTVLLRSTAPPQAPMLLDVNGDGIEETVMVEDAAVVLQKNKSQISTNYIPTAKDYDTNALSGDETTAESTLIKAGASVYLLKSDGIRPSLYFYGDQLEEHLICVFNKNTGYSVLTPYEILKALTDKDLLQFAIEHLDIEAVKILLQHGYDLNKNADIESTSYLSLAVSEVISFYTNHPEFQDNDRGKSFIEALLNLGAKSGVIKAANLTDLPLWLAIKFKRADIVDLLLLRDGALYRNVSSDVLESFKDKRVRYEFLLKITMLQGGIDYSTLSYALEPGNIELLRSLVDTGLQLIRYDIVLFNGKNVDLLNPFIISHIKLLDNSDEVFALARKLHAKIPEKNQNIGFRFFYETDKKFVYMSTISVLTYSPELEQGLVNFSTSVCMHLIGGNCGSQLMQDSASKWLDSLPIICTKELSRTFDVPTCKLAMYWVKLKEFPIAMANKQSPGETMKNSCTPIKAFSDLGTRSIRSFLGRILAP